MALDPKLKEIFAAWYEYEYSADEDEKARWKDMRNRRIENVLASRSPNSSVSDFLKVFRDDYRAWLVSERLVPSVNRRRF